MQSGCTKYECGQRNHEQKQRRRLWYRRRDSKKTLPLPSLSILADDLALIIDPGGTARAGTGKGYIGVKPPPLSTNP